MRGNVQLLSYYYQRYQLWFWFILFILFESGAVSKYFFRSSLGEAILNAALGLLSLYIFFRLRRKTLEHSADQIKNGRLIATFTLLGALAGGAILPYLSEASDIQTFLPYQLPILVGSVLAIFQTALLTCIASSVGLGLAIKVKLDAPMLRQWLYEGRFPRISKKWIAIALIGSFSGTFIVAMLETFIFQERIAQLASTPNIPLWKGALTALYGGIVEEVLIRLFLMTFLVWVLSRFQKTQNRIPSHMYWVAILVSSLIFGLGHLPATSSFYGELTPILVTRALVGNGLLGIFFGYLYWKKGLEYSILSHMAADISLHVVWVSLLMG
jgi:membrane protease YdiL (CAAX protease family)